MNALMSIRKFLVEIKFILEIYGEFKLIRRRGQGKFLRNTLKYSFSAKSWSIHHD